MSEDAAASGFTPGETALLVTIMQNLKSTIDFDADAVASQLGYKNGGIVKTRWGQIKRKKIDGAVGGSPGGGVKKRVATPKKGVKGKGKVADGEDDEEGERVDTPVKRKGKVNAKKRDGKEDGDGEKESDGEGDAKVKTEAGDESDTEF